MEAVDFVMQELRSKASEKTRATYIRHGGVPDQVIGVSVADLKILAKPLKGNQAAALRLYETGVMEAMYLGGILADGKKMSRAELESWAAGGWVMPMISEYTVPWVTVENAQGRELALEWIDSGKEHVASAGWCTLSGLAATKPDDELDLKGYSELLRRVVDGIGGAQNRVRYTMNGFVISVGSYVEPLLGEALAAAVEIGNVSVDVGPTACEVPVASAYIAKMETAGKLGKKKKTIRC